MKTPLNKKTISRHFQYSWWMYVLSGLLCFFFWNLFFTMTAPRTPEDQKLEVYIYAYGDNETANQYLSQVQAQEMQDVLEMSAMYLLPDDSSGLMVLATRLMAGEGDIFLLPRDAFQSYATQGLFVAIEGLEGIAEQCEAAGVNLERGWRKNQDTGERHLYGIPVSSMPGLAAWSYTTGEMYLCIRYDNGNDENAEKLVRIMLRDYLPAPVSAET